MEHLLKNDSQIKICVNFQNFFAAFIVYNVYKNIQIHKCDGCVRRQFCITIQLLYSINIFLQNARGKKSIFLYSIFFVVSRNGTNILGFVRQHTTSITLFIVMGMEWYNLWLNETQWNLILIICLCARLKHRMYYFKWKWKSSSAFLCLTDRK